MRIEMIGWLNLNMLGGVDAEDAGLAGEESCARWCSGGRIVLAYSAFRASMQRRRNIQLGCWSRQSRCTAPLSAPDQPQPCSGDWGKEDDYPLDF